MNFGPLPRAPPLINFVRVSYMLDIDIIDHVAGGLSPLACHSAAALGPESVLTNQTRGRSAWPPSLS